jgi:hypothetical protein
MWDGGEHLDEERVGDVAVKQTVPVSRKRGRVPGRVVDEHPSPNPPRVSVATARDLMGRGSDDSC